MAHFSKLISNCPTKLFLEKTVFLNFQTFTFISPFFLEWNVLNLLAEVMRQDGRNNFLTCLEEQFEWKKLNTFLLLKFFEFWGELVFRRHFRQKLLFFQNFKFFYRFQILSGTFLSLWQKLWGRMVETTFYRVQKNTLSEKKPFNFWIFFIFLNANRWQKCFGRLVKITFDMSTETRRKLVFWSFF